MDQKTLPVISLETDEYAVHSSMNQAVEISIASQLVLNENLEKDQLQLLRFQLIRKNRLLTDLRRQLLAAQSTLAQLYCMTDTRVSASIQTHQQVTDTPISLLNCALNAMQELDSSSDRMSYLVKQLRTDRLSPKT